MKKYGFISLLLLAGCSDDFADVPEELVSSANFIQLEIMKNQEMRLQCFPLEIGDRWAVHCRNYDAVWYGPAFEIFQDVDSYYGVVAVPVNGKAMQYSEKFQKFDVAKYEPSFNLSYTQVGEAFNQAYPVE